MTTLEGKYEAFATAINWSIISLLFESITWIHCGNERKADADCDVKKVPSKWKKNYMEMENVF